VRNSLPTPRREGCFPARRHFAGSPPAVRPQTVSQILHRRDRIKISNRNTNANPQNIKSPPNPKIIHFTLYFQQHTDSTPPHPLIISNRESLRLETRVTRTKQRPAPDSNREKEALFSGPSRGGSFLSDPPAFRGKVQRPETPRTPRGLAAQGCPEPEPASSWLKFARFVPAATYRWPKGGRAKAPSPTKTKTCILPAAPWIFILRTFKGDFLCLNIWVLRCPGSLLGFLL
jgi:hypothetical protein